ncbi:MAG: hypothetical protein NC429_09785 [Lachnospiraceae bacterium]|nr:hypothetical protein [Lachnospiraceae bacterium]
MRIELGEKGKRRLTQINKVTRALAGNREFMSFSRAVLFIAGIHLLSLCIMAMFGDYENIRLKDFLDAWTRWDSSHYLNIAQNGYQGAVEDGQHLFLVFYPLYPWLIRIVSFLFMGNYQLAGILVSTISFGIGNVYLDKLMRLEYGEKAADETAALLKVYPFAFFFASIMTESLFLAVSTAFLYYLRKHDWWDAALVGFLACLTRVQGILLAFCVIAEVMYSYHGITLLKNRRWKEIWKKIICNGLKCVPMAGGTLIYLIINYYVEGDPFRFRYYLKEHWSQELQFFWKTFRYVRNNAVSGWDTQFGAALWDPSYILIFVFITAIIYGSVKKCRPMYMTYLILYFLLIYSVTWLLSAGRYSANALPLFMLSGEFLSKHPKLAQVIKGCLLGLMIVYMVGYYQWKSIM